MNFISLEFLLFFPLVLLLSNFLCHSGETCSSHRIPLKMSGRVRLLFLLAASYLFYMNGISARGGLLLLSTVCSWLLAGQIQKQRKRRLKKVWLSVAVLYCTGCLLLFKRPGFLVPGISFYIFQMLSYVIDVYRKRAECERDFAAYALYVSFFPQLAAGPVERAGRLLPQLKQEQAAGRRQMTGGLWLILRGFFKKLAVADELSGFVEPVFEAPQNAGGLTVLIAVFFFSIQIYCDFSGYTDIARGSARMMGIELMENFAHPYQAETVRDFWRRWHISLSRWFTDYLYIPLGGSRRGIFCTCRNILIVFTASGLWHGLSLNYAVWGLLHGTALAVFSIREYVPGKAVHKKSDRRTCTKLHRMAARAGTFLFICYTWIFFRAESLSDAWILSGRILLHFLDDSPGQMLHVLQMQTADVYRILLLSVCLQVLDRMPEVPETGSSRQKEAAVLAGFYLTAAAALSWLVLAAENGGNVFLYFSF